MYTLKQGARQRLERLMLARGSTRAAKQAIPYALAHLTKWLSLMDRRRDDFKPFIPTVQDLENLPDFPIEIRRMYRLEKVIARTFRPAWWNQLADKCSDPAEAKQAWNVCLIRIYRLLDAATRGLSNEVILQHVTDLENCLHG